MTRYREAVKWVEAFLAAWERGGFQDRIEYVRHPGEPFRVLLASHVRTLLDRVTLLTDRVKGLTARVAELEAAGEAGWEVRWCYAESAPGGWTPWLPLAESGPLTDVHRVEFRRRPDPQDPPHRQETPA